MASNGYYVNSNGVALGPYSDSEIQPRLRAQAVLTQFGENLYFTRADSLEEATRKIKREHARTTQR